MAALRNNDYHVNKFYNDITKSSPLLYEYQFTVEFIGGPFAAIKSEQLGPVSNFTYFAQSASLPKYDITKAKVSYYGITFNTPGTIKYAHEWSCDILLDQKMYMYEIMRAWMRSLSDLRINGGGNRVIPNCDLKINILDSTHQYVLTTYRLVGIWPNNIGEIKLAYKGDDNTVQTAKFGFKYQYCYEEQKGDPLAGASTPML